MGNKGVGKTALLFYLKNQLEQEDINSLCSMILFKRNISVVERAQMDKLQKELISNLDISERELIYVRDFTKIWTLLIYSKIVEDNIKSNYRIFEYDVNWSSFEKFIRRLNNAKDNILKLASTIPQNLDITYQPEKGFVTDNFEPYPENEDAISLGNFYKALDYADKLFQSLCMKEHKYFIFIDELEAYNNDRDIFIRDLTMIRDLINTTKRMNELIRVSGFKKMKVVLSVRSEMINSISNELAGHENNKNIDGFAEKINWGKGREYGGYHPLFAIWLKRIEKAVYHSEESYLFNDIYKRWFPDMVGIEEPRDFILQRTWYKPRDIIRFMNILANISGDKEMAYSAKNLMASLYDYARESRIELTEELGGTYSNNDIKKLFLSLTAFKKEFTKEEYREHVRSNIDKSCIFNDLDRVLDNLYRVGVIGCINKAMGVERWSFLGADTPIIGDGWKYGVHKGLWSELQLQQDTYNGIPLVEIVGFSFKCRVISVKEKFFLLSFYCNGKKQKGKIHIKDVNGKYIQDKDKYLGEDIYAYVTNYDEQQQLWKLSGI